MISSSYITCELCSGSGIWSGEFHSGVCALCDGLGLTDTTGTKVSFETATGLLNKRHIHFRRTYQKMCAIHVKTQPRIVKTEIGNRNDQYTHIKSKPLFWEPKSYESCASCGGSGLYKGLFNPITCGACRGSCITGANATDLPDHEQIAILAFRNKLLKRLIKELSEKEDVQTALAQETRQYEEKHIR